MLMLIMSSLGCTSDKSHINDSTAQSNHMYKISLGARCEMHQSHHKTELERWVRVLFERFPNGILPHTKNSEKVQSNRESTSRVGALHGMY